MAMRVDQSRQQRRAVEVDAPGRQGPPVARAQSAVEQGVDKASERLQSAGKKSALLSSRTQKAMSDAKQKVSQATESVAQPNSSNQKQASALGEAADALTQAAASLARDRGSKHRIPHSPG